MKQVILVCIMVMVGAGAWRIGSQLSSDAISMAVGVLFGVLAGVPMALMVLASSRRRDGGREGADERANWQGMPRVQYGGYMPQPPVIVVTGTQQGVQAQPGVPQRYLPSPNDISLDAREFKVVGEREEWIDEW